MLSKSRREKHLINCQNNIKVILPIIVICLWFIMFINTLGLRYFPIGLVVCIGMILVLLKSQYCDIPILVLIILDIIWRMDAILITYKEDRILFSILMIISIVIYWFVRGNVSIKIHRYYLGSAVIISFMFIGYNLLFYSNTSILIKILEILAFSIYVIYIENISASLICMNFRQIKCTISTKVVIRVCFLVMFLASFFLLIIYYPGIYSTDVLTCWEEAEDIFNYYNRSDAHSFFYVALLAGYQIFSNNIFGVCFLNSLLLAGTISLILGYLYNNGLDIRMIIILVMMYIIFPFNMHLTISATKDVIYTIALLHLTFNVIKLIYEREEYWNKKTNVIHFLISGLCTGLLRSNGLVAILCCSIFTIIFCRKYAKRLSVILTVLILILIVGIKTLVYPLLNVQSGVYGLASYPFIDGIWINVYYDNPMNDEILEYLEEIMPIEEWKENYKMKYTNGYVLDYSKLNTIKSIKGWCWCLVHYPSTTIKSRLCKTQALWSIFQTEDSYYSYNITVESHPKAEKYGWYYLDSSKKLRSFYYQYFFLTPFSRVFIILGNGGWNLFIWIILTISILKTQKNKVAVLIPIGGSCLALLLCSCFSDYRYVWPMFLITIIYMAVVKTEMKK